MRESECVREGVDLSRQKSFKSCEVFFFAQQWSGRGAEQVDYLMIIQVLKRSLLRFRLNIWYKKRQLSLFS